MQVLRTTECYGAVPTSVLIYSPENQHTQIAGTIGWSGPHVPHGVPTRRRATYTPYGSDISCFGALTSIDAHGLRNALFFSPANAPQSPEKFTDPSGSFLCPIDAELRQQRKWKQRQRRCRFAGFHGGRVSATIVVSVCMLSLLSVAVGANASVKPVGEWPIWRGYWRGEHASCMQESTE